MSSVNDKVDNVGWLTRISCASWRGDCSLNFCPPLFLYSRQEAWSIAGIRIAFSIVHVLSCNAAIDRSMFFPFPCIPFWVLQPSTCIHGTFSNEVPSWWGCHRKQRVRGRIDRSYNLFGLRCVVNNVYSDSRQSQYRVGWLNNGRSISMIPPSQSIAQRKLQLSSE